MNPFDLVEKAIKKTLEKVSVKRYRMRSRFKIFIVKRILDTFSLHHEFFSNQNNLRKHKRRRRVKNTCINIGVRVNEGQKKDTLGENC